MTHRKALARVPWLALLGALAAAEVQGQKPALQPNEYGRFEALSAPVLSAKGRWLAYRVTRIDEKAELRVRALDGDSVRVYAEGSQAAFSLDERWLAFAVSPGAAQREQLEKDKKPIRLSARLLDLVEGTERSFEAVQARAFDATGRYLVLHGYAPDQPKGRGADLRVLDLTGGNGAELLGMQDRIGRVAPGYFADIIAVEGDPLASIDALIRGVRWVMKGGQVVVNRTGITQAKGQ